MFAQRFRGVDHSGAARRLRGWSPAGPPTREHQWRSCRMPPMTATSAIRRSTRRISATFRPATCEPTTDCRGRTRRSPTRGLPAAGRRPAVPAGRDIPVPEFGSPGRLDRLPGARHEAARTNGIATRMGLSPPPSRAALQPAAEETGSWPPRFLSGVGDIPACGCASKSEVAAIPRPPNRSRMTPSHALAEALR